MLRDKRFYFRPVLTVVSVFALTILMGLGNWQLQRRAWKIDLISNVESRLEAPPISFFDAIALADSGEDMRYIRVSLSGEYLPDYEEKIFGAIEGAPGYFLFTPMRVATDREVGPIASSIIYVNRGFAPQRLAGVDIAKPSTASVQISGLLRYAEHPSPPASWFVPTEQSLDGYWHIRDPKLFAGAADFSTVKYYIDADVDQGNEWPKGGTTRIDFRNKHLEYALTWFGLAAVLFGVFVSFSLQKPPPANSHKR